MEIIPPGALKKNCHLAQKYARIFVCGHYLFRQKRTVFWERSSSKTVSFKEQIMSKDKYPSIFSPQMETIVFIILQIFYATRAVLKIGVYSWISPSFSWGILSHVTSLDQSRACEKIWWIINIHVPQNLAFISPIDSGWCLWCLIEHCLQYILFGMETSEDQLKKSLSVRSVAELFLPCCEFLYE